MSEPRAALERLLASLSAAEESAAFVEQWGDARPSPRSSRRLLIESPADPAFAELEVRPWDNGAIGGVAVDFADESVPSFADLDEWFGPFEELPPATGGTVTWQAHWWREPFPVETVLLVEDPEDRTAPVTQLSVRRGRSRPG